MAVVLFGIMMAIFVLYYLISFISVIINMRKMSKILYSDVITGGNNWLYFEKKGNKLLNSRFKPNDYAVVHLKMRKFRSFCTCFGVEEGNVCIHYAGPNQNMQQQLPEWSYNVEQSNKTGLINIMYLDTTGGKNAFSKELLAKDENIVLRLQFRLRGSARVGDIYDLVIEDAVFAASDETQSLAMLQNTLKVKNSKIVIGE
jgi:hypothetical protein